MDTAETYMLSAESVDAVKVRVGLMDVKHLVQVDDGLELWKPVMKSPMPISAADAQVVLAALRVSAPLDRDRYDLTDLVRTVNGAVRVVPVHKTRRHFTIESCMAELTDLRAGAESTRTIAIESEAPARVIAAVRAGESSRNCATSSSSPARTSRRKGEESSGSDARQRESVHELFALAHLGRN